MNQPIFFDHVSTTPLDRRVLEAMMPYLTGRYGNPSAQFTALGRQAAGAVEQARRQVARLVGADPVAVIFTAGATEANNLAVTGRAEAVGQGHVVASAIEHFSVLRPLDRLRKRGFDVTLLSVDSHGQVDPAELEAALRPDTILVSLMAANPEIGSLARLSEIGAICHRHGVPLHTDATVAAGLIPLDMSQAGPDLVSLSGHNLYGPKGIGALVARPEVALRAQILGGEQERGLRSGTENVAGIVGFGMAAELARAEGPARAERLARLGGRLWRGLDASIDHLHFTGDPDRRLPGHVSFWVEFAEGESILLQLSLLGIMAASGSSCASNIRARHESELTASHVLTSIGVPSDICAGSITFSLGKDNTRTEVDEVLRRLPPIIQRLWAMSPAYHDFSRGRGDDR